MIVRVLEPRCIGSRQSYESAQRFLAKADSRHTVQMVEIVKRPGQTLGEISMRFVILKGYLFIFFMLFLSRALHSRRKWD